MPGQSHGRVSGTQRFMASGATAHPQVFRHSSSGGKLLNVPVELGVPEIVSRTREFEAQLGS